MEGSFRTKDNGTVEYRIYINGKQKSFYGKTKEEAIDKYKKFVNDKRSNELYEASLLTDTSGIRINKNTFEYRKSINGKQVSFNTINMDDALRIKNYVDEKLEQHGFTDNMNNKKKIKENQLGKYVYFISNGIHCKVGVSANVNKRLSDLQVGSSEKLNLLYSFYTNDYDNIETQLHKLFEKYHIAGEWYDILFLFEGDNNE